MRGSLPFRGGAASVKVGSELPFAASLINGGYGPIVPDDTARTSVGLS